MSRAVLLDAGPVIHLDELGRLDLFKCFEEVLIPSEVWTESIRHRRDLRLSVIPNAVLLDPAPRPSPRLRHHLERFDLDEGESAALSWLELFGDGTLVSDDGDARDAAEQLSFRVVGTLGLIIKASKNGLISLGEARGLFDRIKPETSLHASVGLLSELKAMLLEGNTK